eukprot:TRINITY_DN522_c0_g1_i1.p1 TRINITY_DN522_c0_g1~~TRINITY_DN522_c0_g1_i1.p1  ORF type:complete len:1116 (+),score=140.57 TRINITY_DN522_c0_g1_i1:36-3383(+)
MLRSLLLLCMLPPALSAGCDCTTTCLTTSDSPSAAWCEVDYTTCSSALWRYSYTTWSYIAYVYCSTGTDSSVTCECASSWTDNAGSWTSDPSTCSTTQSGCPDTACNNMEAYAYTYGIVSWCVVGNAPCKDAPANPSGSAYMKCTPTETATSCDCRSSWTYMGKTYTGCQTTQDSPSSPWCMVDWTCNSASFGYDTTTNTSFPYKSCTDGLDASVTCTCDTAGCVNAATPYCVAATTPCATAPKPTAGMDAYVTCTPTDCECQDTWTYSSDTYTGCSTTPDSPSAPWCFVKSDNCSSAYAKNDTAGITSKWKYCTDGLDSTKTCSCSGSCVNDATPYCELGNAPCATSPPVNPAGKAYGTCTPTECECLASWTYDGTSHSGCDGTVDSYGYTWCIVDSTCKEAVSGTDPSSSATFYSLYCDSSTSAPSTAVPVTTNTPTTDPCACLSAWYYNYTYYYGCQTTRDGTAPWCMVNSTCTDSPLTGYDSTDGFSFYYKFCSDGLDASVTCTCTGGCVNADTPYCAVANAPCDVAPSPSPSNVGAFMYCVPDACKCLDSWTYNGTSHAGCDGTAVDSYGYTWCAVDSSCKSAASGTDPSSSVTFYSLYCSVTTSAPSTPVPATGAPATSSPSGTSSPTDPCACLSTWYYNYTYYYGCQTTRDGTAPWCMVDGACTDSPYIGTDSTNNNFTFYYKFCSDGLDSSVTCTCAGDCVNTDTPYCAVANAPCDVAPSPSPSNVGAFMYCVPDACKCLDSWTYNSQQYTGCSTTPDSPSSPWCYVADSCLQAYDKNATIGIMSKWRTCSDSLDSTKTCSCSGSCVNDATPYCELGNAPCDSSPPANPAGKAYGTCTPTECACLSSWTYNGTSHSGCDGATDSYGYTWCAVSSSCNAAANITDYYNGATIYALYCTMNMTTSVPETYVPGTPPTLAPPTNSPTDACACLSTWYYNYTYYNGCQTTRDGTAPWCMVSGACANSPLIGYDSTNCGCVRLHLVHCRLGLQCCREQHRPLEWCNLFCHLLHCERHHLGPCDLRTWHTPNARATLECTCRPVCMPQHMVLQQHLLLRVPDNEGWDCTLVHGRWGLHRLTIHWDRQHEQQLHFLLQILQRRFGLICHMHLCW